METKRQPKDEAEAVARVRTKHPRIIRGKWYASWLPDQQGRKEIDCWWVTNNQGRKSGRREWTVDAEEVREIKWP